MYDWPTYLDKRSDKNGFDILLGTSTPKLDPTSMAFLRGDFVGWTDSPELPSIIKEFKTAPSLEEAKLIFNDLQEWFYEYKDDHQTVYDSNVDPSCFVTCCYAHGR